MNVHIIVWENLRPPANSGVTAVYQDRTDAERQARSFNNRIHGHVHSVQTWPVIVPTPRKSPPLI